MSGPLCGIRVLDIATFIAAPFCATILAEFGAEVLKIEQPRGGDSLRKFGTLTDCGDTLLWLSEARNKKSVTLNLNSPQGAELLRRLVEVSDVVVENFRPCTLKNWGLDFEALHKVNPRLVMLSISGYGQTGPNAKMPGFARVAHAFSGLAYLSGEPGRCPVVPGSTSLADYMSGMFGAIGVLIALRHVERTGVGQQIDLGLYESVFRILDEIAPVYARTGLQREAMGADMDNIVPHSHYPTADGKWVALACSNDRMWQRLARAMGREDLGTAAAFATIPQRNAQRAEVNGLVTAWTQNLPCAQILAECARHEVPCSKLMSIAEIFHDPQFAARQNLMEIEDPRVGAITLPSPVPKMSVTPPVVEHAGPALGAANDEILGDLLGLTSRDIAALKAQGVV